MSSTKANQMLPVFVGTTDEHNIRALWKGIHASMEKGAGSHTTIFNVDTESEEKINLNITSENDKSWENPAHDWMAEAQAEPDFLWVEPKAVRNRTPLIPLHHPSNPGHLSNTIVMPSASLWTVTVSPEQQPQPGTNYLSSIRGW